MKINNWTILKILTHGKCESICSCGLKKKVMLKDIKSGHSKSCGCLRRDPEKVKESSMNQIYAQYKNSAKKRKIAFNICKLEFKKLILKNCDYCNQEPNSIYKDYSRHHSQITKKLKQLKYNGIDRVNDNVGYSLKNCVTCCKNCNYAKRNMSKAKFLEWIQRVYNFSILKGK